MNHNVIPDELISTYVMWRAGMLVSILQEKKGDNFARLLSSLSNVWRLKQGLYVYLFVTSHDEIRNKVYHNGVPKLLKGAL